MALRDTLEAVLREYDSAKLTEFVGNPLAAFISKEAVLNLEKAAGPAAVGLLFAGSAGAENWAEVPWLAAFDPVVTDSATRGYYVVYLFHVSELIVHLSLNQGTTAVREEFGAIARQVLSERATLIRKRLPDFLLRLPATQIALGSTARLPGDYAAGHVLGVTYSLDNLPNEQTLADDLRSALQAYRALTFRAGSDEPETEVGGVFEQPQALTELRQYRRRHATVMFCDLVHSNGIASKLYAEKWHDLVGFYLNAASAVVTEMAGKVSKELGDGLIALFGYQVPQESMVASKSFASRRLRPIHAKNRSTTQRRG
jgi:MrcB-like, N-terminal domain